MAALANLARMTTATTGTGTITLGSAVIGFLTFAAAGITDAQEVSYAIEDGLNREVGRGTYTHSGTTLTRTVLASTDSGSPIDLSGNAQVFITALAEDIAQLARAQTWTKLQTFKPDSGTIAGTFVYENDGAAEGPLVRSARISASPAANDLIGVFEGVGRNSSNQDRRYAAIKFRIIDSTATSEDGEGIGAALVNGSEVEVIKWRQGVVVGAPTDGDKGAGSVNAITYWMNGVQLTSAATTAIGVSGATIPLLNGTNTWANKQTHLGFDEWGDYDASGATNGKAYDGNFAFLSSRTSTGTATHYSFANPNGTVGSIATAASATAYNTSSDERLKEFIDPTLDPGSVIPEVAALLSRFRWIRSGEEDYGLSAQKLEAIYPRAVSPGEGEPGEEGFRPYGVDASKLVYPLIAYVMQLQERIKALEAKKRKR